MAKGQLIGCFGLTEPDAGSDPAGMQTIARRDGEQWTISGTKRWIGLASIADIAVIWAKTDKGVRGFLVPTFRRASQPRRYNRSSRCAPRSNARSHLDNVRLTEGRSASVGDWAPRHRWTCLDEARYGILWGVSGCCT